MKSRHVFGRHNAADMPAAIAGDGCFIIDQDGNRYLDGSGGAAVSCLGHSDMAVRDAMLAQAGSLSFAHTAFFTSHPAEKLAERPVSYTHLRAHETGAYLVCRLLLEKKKKN